MNPIDECMLSLDRAKEHFDALHGEVAAFFDDDPPQVIAARDAECGDWVVRIPQPPVFPAKWGVVVGEISYNARAALDHLVYLLAMKGGGKPDRERTAFPIFESKDDYCRPGRGRDKRTNRDKYLAGVADIWKSRVDDLQPYHLGNRAQGDPLAVLSRLNNAAKHQLLRVAHTYIDMPTFGVLLDGRNAYLDLAIYMDANGKFDNVEFSPQWKDSQALSGQATVLFKDQPGGNLGTVEPRFGDLPDVIPMGHIKIIIQWSESIVRSFKPAFDTAV